MAGTLLTRPSFTVTEVGTPGVAARRLCRDLLLFHWPLYAEFRRLGVRFANLAASPIIRMTLEHVTDDADPTFHVDAIGLRLLCTYAGPGIEWVDAGGDITRLTTMEVAIFKGSTFPDHGPLLLYPRP